MGALHMPELPEVSDSHRQERRGDRAFLSVLPETLFVARKETPDYGNDWILEIQIGGRASNHRVYCQLKTIDRPRRLGSGVLSYPVDLSNLRYLLNQPNSVMVVFAEDTQRLLWEWARVISQEAKQAGVDIEGRQKTFSYHFSRDLDIAAFREIHATALRTGGLVRDVTEILSAVQPGATVQVSFEAGSDRIISPVQASEILREQGISLANQGRYSEVEHLLRLASGADDDPYFAFVAAYFRFRRGEYFQALRHLPRIDSGLDEEQTETAAFLRATLRFLVGLSSEAEYQEDTEGLLQAYPNGLVSLKIRLDAARRELIEADRTEATYADKLKAYETAVADLEPVALEHPVLALELRFYRWEVAGSILLRDILESIFVIEGNAAIDRLPPEGLQEGLVRKVIQGLVTLHQEFLDILRTVTHLPAFEARVRTTHARLQLLLLSDLEVLSAHSKQAPSVSEDQRQAALKELLDSLQKAIALCESCQDHGGRLRTVVTQAECLYAIGEHDQAYAIAQQAMEEAHVLGASDIVSMAKGLLSGRAIFDIGSLLKENEPVVAEEDIPRYARQFAMMRGLPDDRLPNIEEGYRWHNDVERLRLEWCQNAGYRQYLAEGLSPETEYVRPPLMKCVCELHRCETPPSRDRASTLQRLKAYCCLGCPDRSPFRSEA